MDLPLHIARINTRSQIGEDTCGGKDNIWVVVVLDYLVAAPLFKVPPPTRALLKVDCYVDFTMCMCEVVGFGRVDTLPAGVCFCFVNG